MEIKDVQSMEDLNKLLYGEQDNNTDDDEGTDESDNQPLDTSGEPSNEPETDDPGEDDQPSDDPVREAILKLTPQELVKLHPSLSGFVGSQADRLARKRLEEERLENERLAKERQKRAEDDALLRLADTDPDAATAAIKERITKERDQEAQQLEASEHEQKFGQMLNSEIEEIYRTPFFDSLARELTDDQLVKMYWKNGSYTGFSDWAEGMLSVALELGREQGRKEAGTPKPTTSVTEPKTPVQKQVAKREARTNAFSANLDAELDESGALRPGDVAKMDQSYYEANRDSIKKSIFGG